MSPFCACSCHRGSGVFCSCWRACCHQPHAPEAEQTAQSKTSSIPVTLKRVMLPSIPSATRKEA
jgi:hypothetical protein